MKQLACAAAAALLLTGIITAQSSQGSSAVAGDWTMYSHDLAGTRFSPLADLNTANVSGLTQAWSVQLTQPAGRGRGAAPPPAPEEAGGAGRGAAPAPGGGVAAGRGGAGRGAA